jgi:hypothetical protein
MSPIPEKQMPGLSRSWRYLQAKASDHRPQKTGGIISLYIAVVAAVAVYYLFS